ncbi:MAG: hypothetical protein HC908_12330 [Calothrix sp. SM1_7_51]|nr:hypothetical protein [Calothrix sp. SM1_7_51]
MFFSTNQDDFSKLSYMTEVTESTLWSMTFNAKTYDYSKINQVNGFGESFHASLINENYFTICPVCLVEQPYYFKAWDLVYVTVCPFHKCRLIDSCPVCGQTINFSTTSFFQCQKCMFDFTNWFEKAILKNGYYQLIFIDKSLFLA